MNFILPINIWPIFRLLSEDEQHAPGLVAAKLRAAEPQEAINRPNIDWQDQIHRGICRGLRNISENP